jgi:fibronectin-binding autotransporter adhesin
MITNLRTRILSGLIFFTLIASAVFTVPAMADSGLPPAPPAPSGPASSGSGTTQILSQVPNGTNIVGGNHSGHKVDMASQKAAYAVQPGDPIWCPSTVAVPVSGAAGCTFSQTNLYNLISTINSHTAGLATVTPNKNGTIWITGGADGSALQIVIDGSNVNFGSWQNFSLLLKGGWNGLGTGSVNPANPSKFDGVGISIANWNNDVTLSNISVNNAPFGQDGIDVQSSKNINLTNVISSNGQMYGAHLDDSAGTGVTITNSGFYQNDIAFFGSYGVWVQSAGPITVTNLNASGNDFHGAYLDNTFGTSGVTLAGTNIFDMNNGFGLEVLSNGTITSGSISANTNVGVDGNSGVIFNNTTAASPLPVTITGSSTFTGNKLDGLDIYSHGNITVNNVTSVGNGNYGGFLENDYSATTPSAIHVNGTNLFSKNGWDGLDALSDGAISLNNISANGNGVVGTNDGLYAQNSGASTAQSITLTGTNTFNNNKNAGALIQASGKVSLSSVTANGNITSFGVAIQNTYLGNTKPQTVTLLGTNALMNNNADNLDIATYGAIALNNLTASGSVTGYGANLYYNLFSSGSVTLTGASNFNQNNFTGLNIVTSGKVLINALNALSNTGVGINIDNSASTTLSPVTLNGLVTTNYNGSTGLVIDSKGVVLTNGLDAEVNGGGVVIFNSFGSVTSPVTLNGINTFNKNNATGLSITSFGAVVTSGLNANGNLGNGAFISNNGSSAFVPITLSGFSTFNYNGSAGLVISSEGVVLTNGLNALSNNGTGATIDNNTSSTSHSVTLAGVNTFNKNSGTGLNINSNGAVFANNLTALTNTGIGVSITNTGSSAASAVTLGGLSVFNYNGSSALQISSNGAVITNGLRAVSNGNGVNIFNAVGSFTSPVTLNGGNTFDKNSGNGLTINSFGTVIGSTLIATSNSGSGVVISTEGTITMGGLTTMDNTGGNGATIDNSSAGSSQPVTLNGINIFNNNGGTGLDILSKGVVLASNLTALTNGGPGVNIANVASSAASAVTLNGLSTLNYNTSTALQITSNGAVITNGLMAVSNGNGVNIFNAIGSFTSQVTLNGGNTFDKNSGNGLTINSFGKVITTALTSTSNSGSGVVISTQGAISMGGLIAVDNTGGNGATIDNSSAASSQPVTLNGINTFNNNSGVGLNILSKGIVLANNLVALTNGSIGVIIDNSASSTASAVTLGGLSAFNYNGSTGLQLSSKGTVITSGLSALSNGGGGVNIFNAVGSFTSPVTLNGGNTFEKNSGNGLTINSNGTVITAILNANSNTGRGATIDNSGSSIIVPITLLGGSTFNYNGSGGVLLNSKGAISTSSLAALSNVGSGATITTNSSSAHTVSLSGLNTFKDNSTGLTLVSNGTVIVNSLISSSNLGSGTIIDNTSSTSASPVTLNGISIFAGNGSTGLTLISKGTVLTNGLSGSNNGSGGAIIDNSTSTSSPVTLKGINTFNNNGSTGLTLVSKGTVLTNGLSGSNNGSTGAIIDNSGSSAVAPVTLLGLSTFNFNGSTGLTLISKNTVLTNGLSALNNGSTGVIIDNSASTSSSAVTLKGVDNFNNNGATGLILVSKGTVLTNGLSGSNNGSSGAIIDNTGSSTVAPVTLKGLNSFNNNGSSGLIVSSLNAITTSSLTANDNGSNGVILTNNALGVGAIKVLGKNVIFGNGSTGIMLESNGPVTVTNISSKFNKTDGLFVDTTGNVSVSCGSFSGNGTGHVSGYGFHTGIDVTTVTLTGVTIAGNYSGDILKDNGGGTTITFIPKTCVLP